MKNIHLIIWLSLLTILAPANALARPLNVYVKGLYDSRVISDVPVVLTNGTGQITQVVTDSQGLAAFGNLPAGIYSFKIYYRQIYPVSNFVLDNSQTPVEYTVTVNPNDTLTDDEWLADYLLGWRTALNSDPCVANNTCVSNAQFISQQVPAAMKPGRTYSVQLVMKNNGTKAWTFDDNAQFKLGSQNPYDNATWGLWRVNLAAGEVVLPGATKVFNFNVTAPFELGTHNFQWRMVHERYEWFGEVTPNISIVVDPSAPAQANAQFISQYIPAAMNPGQTYSAQVVMKNIGTETWTADGNLPFNLGSQNPYDNATWGFWRVKLAAGEVVLPGATKAFNFNVTAPSEAGTHNFQWRMVHDGVEWFGETTPNRSIVVTAPLKANAQFISQQIPAAMYAGQTYTAQLVMKNNGAETWTADGNMPFKLGSQNPYDNATWGFWRVNLAAGEIVPPGAVKTFYFNVKAPSAPGTYNFQWRMVHESVEWFGEISPNQSVVVSPPPPATFSISGFVYRDINTSCPPDPVSADKPGVKNTGEKGMDGRKVYLMDPVNGATFAETVAAADGSYIFAGLTKGKTYRVTHVIPSGYCRTTDDSIPLTVSGNMTHSFGVYLMETSGSSSLSPDTSMKGVRPMSLPDSALLTGELMLGTNQLSSGPKFEWTITEPSAGKTVKLETPTNTLGLAEQRFTAGIHHVSVRAYDSTGRYSGSVQKNVTFLAGSLDGFRVRPNPWRKGTHGSIPVTFDGVPNDSVIKIFTVSGQWVKTISSPANTWDLKNDSGDTVASGIYIYLVTTPQGDKKTGQLVVIR